jgi:uncharacterized membrane-anchored protein YjiN (DUF445 family)
VEDHFSLDAHPADVERARRLRAMKTLATSLLVLAAIVFFLTTRIDDPPTWVGFVTAAAEAAMIGAIADWFAVTALFRHPLGIPIPHTALIPKGKDAIGRGLGEFVQRNFMTPDHLAERITEAGIPARIGGWLEEPTNVTAAAAQLSGIAEGVIELIRDEDVQASIEHYMAERATAIDVGPIVGRGIELVIAEGYHDTLVEASLRGIKALVEDNSDWLRQRLGEESPWWVPGIVDDAVFTRLQEAVSSFIDDLVIEPDHPVRKSLTKQAAEFARKLEHDPELLARLDDMKTRLAGHPEFRAWARSLWTDVKAELLRGLTRPDGELRGRIEKMLGTLGGSLRTDPELRARVDHWLVTFARSAAVQGGEETARAIATTVERWDAAETSHRLELQVGRDLQFIRINGTIVGALAGVVIHALTRLM